MGNCLSGGGLGAGSSGGDSSSHGSKKDGAADPSLVTVTFDDFEPDYPISRTFKLGNELGRGAFSVVRLGTHKRSQKKFAIKITDKEGLPEEDGSALLEEVSILRSIEHPKIIAIYQFYPSDPKHYYSVLEFAPGGELFDRIVKKTYYDEKEARSLSATLVSTVAFMHSKNVIHRDLKPENLLMTGSRDDDVKFADFGFAKSLAGGLRRTQCGTPQYVAPEILRGRPYGASVDVWSLGVILYILLGGYPPFHDENQTQLYRKIRIGRVRFHEEYWKDISAEAKDLIKLMLTSDPDKRITAAEAVQHPWLTSSDADLPSLHLEKNLAEFKMFNARRKLQGVIKAVLAAEKLAQLAAV